MSEHWRQRTQFFDGKAMLKPFMTLLYLITVIPVGVAKSTASNQAHLDVFKQLISAYNSGDKSKVTTFVSDHYQSSDEQWIRDSATHWLDLRSRFGAVAIKHISRETANSLEMWVQGIDSKYWFAPELIFANGTNQIKATGVLMGETPRRLNDHENASFEITKYQSYLEGLANQSLFSGVVLIAKENKVIFHQAFGQTHNEGSEVQQVSLETRFRYSSITKIFTALAILKLVDEGLVNLSDSLQRFALGLPAAIQNQLTIKDLLLHTSGYELDDLKGFSDRLTAQTAIADIMKLHLEYASQLLKEGMYPQSDRFNYSNENHDLLAFLVEMTRENTFQNVLQSNFFDPLDLQSISFKNFNLAASTRYDYERDAVVVVEHRYPHKRPQIGGASGLKGTALDLYRFFVSIKDDKTLFTFPIRSLIFAPMKKVSSSTDRSVVFEINQDPLLHYGHNGTNLGNSATLRYFPEKDLVFIALANNRSGAQLALNHFMNLHR